MRGELAVAGGEECGEGAEEPDDRHDTVGEHHGRAWGTEFEIEGAMGAAMAQMSMSSMR